MKRLTYVVLAFLVLALMALIWPRIITNIVKEACLEDGGKWAANGSYCNTKNCYENKSCGEWAAPIRSCFKIKIDDPISEVYLKLGNPRSIDKNMCAWPFGKGDTGRVYATIIDGKLKSIQCGGA